MIITINWLYFHAGEPPSRVQGVTVTRTVQGSSPALRVSWSAVRGSGITYTVCYSRQLSTQPVRWSSGNCGTSGITGTSTTLGPLSGGTTYLIWVRAVSSGGQGPDSGSVQQKTCNGKLYVLYGVIYKLMIILYCEGFVIFGSSCYTISFKYTLFLPL